MRKALIVAGVLIVTTASAALAADPKAEVGASLATATIGLGNNNSGSTFGIPSGGFGILQPGVYASFFVGPNVAIEPQIGLIWASSNGHAEHLVNVVGQVDYFVTGSSANSPYIFGAAGIIDVSGGSTTPKSVGGGVGYRIVAGDRLTFRIDGRVTHLTDGGGNMLAFGLSIGGLFR
jgi:opacity protein-like surface antigen